VDALAHAVIGTDGAIVVRTEVLVRMAATRRVDLELLAQRPAVGELVQHELLVELDRMLARLGRLRVDDVVVQQDHDPIRNWQVYRAVVLTRESDVGVWPSVWAAIHEDEQDRRGH
jgi:hypothetical protein